MRRSNHSVSSNPQRKWESQQEQNPGCCALRSARHGDVSQGEKLLFPLEQRLQHQ
jgi:hypothetical protein